jgi:Sulfotransferase family
MGWGAVVLARNCVFLHIGAAKTATTTLQRNLFPQLPGIIYLGKPGPLKRGCAIDGLSEAHYVLLERIGGFANKVCPRDDVRELRALVERLKEFGVPVIYSNENLCDNSIVSFAEIAKRLRKAFGPADLILTVRNPVTALPSFYLQEMRRQLCDIPFNLWLDQALGNPRRADRISLEQYQYASTVRQFRTAFDGRIGIFRFEDLVSDPIAFATGLGNFIGVDAELITTRLKSAPKNVAKSAEWYRYQRAYMKVKKAVPSGLFHVPLMNNVKRSAKQALVGAIEQMTSMQPSRSVELSDYDRHRIEQFFGLYVEELSRVDKFDPVMGRSDE